MKHTTITFNAIQTSDLLYYDLDFEELCFKFCKERNIDCLPSLDDSLKFYRRTEDGFSKEEVTPEMRVDCQDNIFNAVLLERFRVKHLLFVYQDQELTGVVHFSDYNRPEVDAYLFSLLSAYERSLRRLLILHGLKHLDMLNFFQSKEKKAKDDETRSTFSRKISEYEKYQERNERWPVFECFYLLDLIGLANRHKIISLRQDANMLRNMVMHAHELVNREDANRDDYIYDFASFEKFYNLVQSLLQDYKKVNNKIAFLELSRG